MIMSHARLAVITTLCVLGQLPAPAAQAFDAASQGVQAYLCQFGQTASAFAFRQGPNGEWQGLGQLQGWDVTVQADGLVARSGDDLLILGDGTASLLQQGRLMRGLCVDAGQELAQLLDADDLAPREDPDPAAVPGRGDDRPDLPDAWVAEVLSILDPGNWDEAQVARLIDSLDMEAPVKQRLKAELKAAARNPERIAGLARQIREAFGMEVAAAADLRARLKDTRRELAAVSRALDDQRQKAQMSATQLAAAEVRARAAEAETAAQIANLRAALNAAAGEEDKMRAALAATTRNLAASEARLALANKRLTKLGGVPVRP